MPVEWVRAEDGVGGAGQVMGSKVEVVLVKVYVQVMIHKKTVSLCGVWVWSRSFPIRGRVYGLG